MSCTRLCLTFKFHCWLIKLCILVWFIMPLIFNSKFSCGSCRITSNFVVSRNQFYSCYFSYHLLSTICLSCHKYHELKQLVSCFPVIFFCQFSILLFCWYCYMNLCIKSSQSMSDSLCKTESCSLSDKSIFFSFSGVCLRNVFLFFLFLISPLYVSELLLNGKESYNNQKGA